MTKRQNNDKTSFTTIKIHNYYTLFSSKNLSYSKKIQPLFCHKNAKNDLTF